MCLCLWRDDDGDLDLDFVRLRFDRLGLPDLLDLSRFGDLFLCDFLGVFDRERYVTFLVGVGDSDTEVLR